VIGARSTSLAALWARAGAMFMATPSPTSPDLERLLLDTARQAAENSRLFIVAASWLAKYGEKVQPLRLAELILNELEPEYSPVMGLLLDIAQRQSGKFTFAAAIAACKPADEPRPLFAIERGNATLRRLSERHASTLSRIWGVWAPEFKPKYDAIRPETWVDAENPMFGRTGWRLGERDRLVLEEAVQAFIWKPDSTVSDNTVI
jgi:hypothetical protein